MTHFLSDYYGELFQLTRLPFVNSDENAFLKFYNTENIKIAGEYNYFLYSDGGVVATTIVRKL